MAEASLIARIAFSTAPFASTPGWTDISNTVLRCSTRRGRNHELDRMESGWAVVQLLNTSGDYWPYNTTGAYTPNVLPAKKINIRAKYGDRWVSPTSHVDPDTAWTWDIYAYDDDTGTYAYSTVQPQTWSSWLELHLSASTLVTSVRYFLSSLQSVNITKIKIDLYYDSAWNNIYEGSLTLNAWTEVALAARQDVSKARIAFWNNVALGGSSYLARFSEFDFNSDYNIYTGFIENWQPGFLSAPDRIPIMTLQCADFIKNTSRLLINNTTGYILEASGTRVANVLSELGWPTSSLTLDAGQSNFQATGALASTNAQDHLFKTQESEPGIVYLTPDGNVAYEDRHHRLGAGHVTSAAVFGDDSGEMGYHRLHLSYDDWYIYNDVRMRILGGAEQVATSTTSQDSYGKRSLSKTDLLNNANADAESQAGYLKTKYENPLMRASEIEIRPDLDPTNLYPKVFGYDISSRITVRHNDSSLDEDYYIEGINHDFIPGKPWDTKWQLSKAEAYQYWKLGVTGFSELGSTTRPFY